MASQKLLAAGGAFFAATLFTAPAFAEPTDITVRVIAKGAKFVGDGMGGVRITLRNAETGEVLAEGVTEGGTGDTARIMETPLTRGDPLWTEGASAFNARLDIEEPLKVRVEATGPLGNPDAAVTVTSEQWVAPGHPITGGDAWLLELPGFVVDIIAPAAEGDAGPATLAAGATAAIEISADIVMMCGCTLTPRGLWDSDGFEISAWIYRDGEKLNEVNLGYADEPSRFAATYAAPDPGEYRIIVIAYDEKSGNTGVDEATVVLE